jgi:hypothetical protein
MAVTVPDRDGSTGTATNTLEMLDPTGREKPGLDRPFKKETGTAISATTVPDDFGCS